MVSVPATNPRDPVAFTVSDAVAVFPGPIVTCCTVPMVFPPVVNVIGPVSVPAVVPVTVAAKVTLLPKGKLVGLMVTVVVVAAVPCATTVIV